MHVCVNGGGGGVGVWHRKNGCVGMVPLSDTRNRAYFRFCTATTCMSTLPSWKAAGVGYMDACFARCLDYIQSEFEQYLDAVRVADEPQKTKHHC